MSVENEIVDMIRRAVTQLPEDVIAALEKAYREEESEIGKIQLGNILKNVRLAGERTLPMCQDTGVQTFFVEVGADFPHIRELKGLITNAVRRATSEIPIRPNAVHPFTNKNSGDNTGMHLPYITWEIVDGDEVTITAFPKGGGSENASALGMLNPGVGVKGIKKFIVEHIVRMGGKPCPPTIVGVGIGGGADLSLKIGKRALLRPVGMRSEDEGAAALEEELIEALNATGIGPMGLGGKTTVLDVHVELAHRHPASLPVGIVVQCWADRRSKIVISPDWKVRRL